MSSDFVDEYYVEAMIRDAWIALRAEINNEINNAIAELDRQTEKEERWGLWVWEELDEGGRT